MLVLGDSFVGGYDVKSSDRFTEKLQAGLLEWDITNLGVSGYSTDQQLLLLVDQFDRFWPRLVLLV